MQNKGRCTVVLDYNYQKFYIQLYERVKSQFFVFKISPDGVKILNLENIRVIFFEVTLSF